MKEEVLVNANKVKVLKLHLYGQVEDFFLSDVVNTVKQFS